MRIRVKDIPSEGRTLEFELDSDLLNERTEAARISVVKDTLRPPVYRFLPPISANLSLNAEGSTVFVQGYAEGRFQTPCSRCAEETVRELRVPLRMVLKPRQSRGPEEARDEDLNFGFYDEQEVDCVPIVEEFLILELPFSVCCEEACQGLCPSCGANLNRDRCSCSVEPESGDERFSVLRGLKLTH